MEKTGDRGTSIRDREMKKVAECRGEDGEDGARCWRTVGAGMETARGGEGGDGGRREPGKRRGTSRDMIGQFWRAREAI